ncbi:MAG: hypothetical protein IKH54_00110 [Bacilli bacterium]|nr:hypothetical protein [Bacilli bacterium]
MNGFSVLFFIFGIMILIAGIVLYTGHKDEVLLWKVYDVKKLPQSELKNIGKWTMISSIIPFIIAIIGVIFKI